MYITQKTSKIIKPTTCDIIITNVHIIMILVGMKLKFHKDWDKGCLHELTNGYYVNIKHVATVLASIKKKLYLCTGR